MSLIRGEYWITGGGEALFADSDTDDHQSLAMWAAYGLDGLDPSESPPTGVGGVVPMEPLSKPALKWLADHDAEQEAVDYLKDGADPRDYAMEKMDWIAVRGDHFQMYDFSDNELARIKDFEGWEEVENPEDSEAEITIESMRDGKVLHVSLKDLFRAKSAEGLTRYKDGIGKWRNPAKKKEKIEVFPQGLLTPSGEFKRAGMNHDWLARALGFENVDAALKAGYVRLAYPEGLNSYDYKANIIEAFDLAKSLPMIQKAMLPYYEALGDQRIYFEERKKNEVYDTSLSVVALGSLDEIRRGVEANPPYFHGSHKEWKVYDLEVAHSLGTGFTSAFDHLGLWLTSDKDRAKNYGPLVHEFDITLENPLVIEREKDHAGFQSEHQPFAEALYDEKLAKKYLSVEDRKAIKAGAEIPWRSRETKRVLKAPETPGSYRDDVQLGLKLLKKKHAFDEAMHRFYENAAYWTALREALLAAGHDAILFKDSLIDVKVDAKPHDVIVYLRPAKVRAL